MPLITVGIGSSQRLPLSSSSSDFVFYHQSVHQSLWINKVCYMLMKAWAPHAALACVSVERVELSQVCRIAAHHSESSLEHTTSVISIMWSIRRAACLGLPVITSEMSAMSASARNTRRDTCDEIWPCSTTWTMKYTLESGFECHHVCSRQH